MAKDLHWFKFSPLKWMTGRIRKEKDKVQIAFIELMCQYWKNECAMTLEQAELEIGDSIHQLVKKKLVKVSGDHIKISFLDEQLVSIADTSAQKSNAAKSRWNAQRCTSNADAMHVHKGAMQNDADKIREEKNIVIHGKGKRTITIKRVFAADPIHKIHDLSQYYKYTNCLDDIEDIGLIHFEAFMEVNSGKIYNDHGHLDNSFRSFCRSYTPPTRAPDPYKDAAWDKGLWTLEAWEKAYEYQLKNDPEFRKYFGYGELLVSKTVGI
jgi:hypothetical protein